MTTNNSAIIQQINQSKSSQSQSEQRFKQNEITDDARITARQDAIIWGQAYKKYLADYKEEARLIINEKLLSDSGDKTLESLDLDETMFFAEPYPQVFVNTNGNKKDETNKPN
ncbi:hypothetical protein [Okeania sp. SIO1F9]|uniref:hypothetical protein n=1 Tax=Okeania sp. SIO1F9 TaxID=2607813 RepID=UPI00144BC2AF|nr:hypothetical protein [Okeania sp. SIO1F9]NET79728.1 hypothetical protein [Okeania sp. SIO1F9]NET79740.1 hypothetical protein [Okeania sp. SIO1F9]